VEKGGDKVLEQCITHRKLKKAVNLNFNFISMFIGEYHYTIDDKARLAVPVKFRDDFEKGAVVTRGIDTCLFLYPKKEWDSLAQKLAQLPLAQAKTRAFSRLMLAGAMDAVVAGLYNRLEIWDEKKWEEYKSKTEGDSPEIAEALSGLGV
jgi:MraZ protein